MKTLVRIFIVLGAIMCATLALAQGSQPSEDDRLEAARWNALNGFENLKKRQYQEALTNFRLADAVVKKPITRLGVARALVGLGRLVEAREQARSVAELPAPENEHPKLVEAREDAAALAKELDSNVARVTLNVSPVGAELMIDGRRVQPGVLDLDPGTHTLRARAAVHSPFEQLVVLKEGERKVVDVRLKRLAGPQSQPPPIIVEPQPSEPVPPLSPSWPERHVGSLITAGAGAAIGLAGIGVAAATLSQYKDLSKTCAGTALGCSQDDKDSVSTKATVTNVLFGVAGAVGVGAVVLYFVEGDSTEQVGVAVGPGGVFVRGAF